MARRQSPESRSVPILAGKTIPILLTVRDSGKPASPGMGECCCEWKGGSEHVAELYGPTINRV